MTMGLGKRTAIAAALLAVGTTTMAADVLIDEGFNTAVLPTNWFAQNYSPDAAAQAWFKGFDDIDHFAAHAGAGDSYVASSFAVVTPDENGDPTGVIDAVLFSPLFAMDKPVEVSFYTRTVGANAYGESLFYGSLVGSSFNELGSVNPDAIVGEYPEGWTRYTFTVAAGAAGSKGRIYFEYFIGDAAVAGNYIGLDTVTVTAVPEPTTWALMAGGLLCLGQLSRRRRAV